MCTGVRLSGGAGHSVTAGVRAPCTDGGEAQPPAASAAAAVPAAPEHRHDNRTAPYLLHSAGNVLLELGGRGRLLRRERFPVHL